MSFLLKSVELKNIRAHEYLLFEPANSGVTAISGETGAGKSTIVDSFAWALYGTRPNGVKNKNLIKDKVNPKEKPVSVKVVLVNGGIEYTVERKIISPSGTTECNVWAKSNESDELKQIAGPSVTHVEKFLKSELGMNEKGFLTSVLIQQKQVDQIVSATPKERGIVIEELTGIASITQAIQKNNENTRALEKAASIFQIGSLEEVEEKVKKQEKVVSELEEKEKNAITIFTETKKEALETMDRQKNESEIQKKKESIERDLESLKKQNLFLEEQAKKDIEYISEFKSKNGTTILVDSKELKASLEEKRKQAYKNRTSYDKLESEVKSNKTSIASCEVLFADFETSKDAEIEVETLEKKLSEKKLKLEETKTTSSNLNSEIKHSENSHKHISGTENSCPVCKSSIENPEELKKQLENESKELQNALKTSKAKEKTFSVEIIQLEENLKKAKNAVQAFLEKDKLEKENLSKTSEMKDLKVERDLLEVDFKKIEEEYENVLQIESEKKSLENAKARSLTVYDDISSNKEKFAKLKEEIDSLNALPERSYLALVKKADDLKEKVQKMSLYGRELMGRKNLEKERLQDYKKDLENIKESLKRYNELAKEIEVSNRSVERLIEFKTDRIEDAIPTLEFYASDFLYKFSGGKFLKLSLDEKFNTFITTSEGIVRPVSQLSGGELSSTAIALRLGISMLLNASDKSLLILDEVLVSMDEERARQIMDTISSMTNSQVIFIAHNAEINSIADKTVLIGDSKLKGAKN